MLSNSNIFSSHVQINGVQAVKAETFEKALAKIGMTKEEFNSVVDTLDSSIAQVEQEEGQEVVDYIAQSILEAKKIADVIEGYKAMGALNLSIADESAHLESEVDKGQEYGKMDKTETKKYA